jgi:protein ImuB
MVDKLQGGLKITACDARASGLGLHPGLTLTAARARLPRLAVEPANPAADAAFLQELAARCEIFTPLTAADGPHGLLLDITGCAHLFGGEQALLERVSGYFTRAGLQLRASISTTPDSAHALARFSTRQRVAPDEVEKAVRPLPIAALELAPKTTLALTRAGLKTLADLSDRPSQTLSARFGMGLITRLNRIMGREDIRLTPLRPAPDIVAEQHFAEPLSLMASLMACLDHLVRSLCAELERQGRGGRLFETIFFHSDGRLRRLQVETAAPLRQAENLLRLFRLRMEALDDPLDPDFGFDAMRLAVLQSQPCGPHQNRLDGPADISAQVADLINQLMMRLGAAEVLRFVAGDSHDPLRAAGMVPVLSAGAGNPWPAPEAQAPHRPLTLFQPPQPIEAVAEVPDGPPLRFRWRRVLHEVARAEGPERIAPEWWRGEPDRPPCDYYCLEDTEGHRFWVFRQGLYGEAAGLPRWFLHGLFA